MLRLAWFNLFFVLFLLLIPTKSLADDFTRHVTLTHHPPGSFRIKYGGIRGFLVNQINSQLWNLHSDYLDRFHEFDYKFQARSREQLRFAQRDLNTGGPWYLRRWWESFPPDKGGAPKGVTTFYVGRKTIVLDIGIAYITPDFRFKLRQYVVDITNPTQPDSWKMRVKPALSFSTTEIINRAGLSVFFQYSRRGIHVIDIEIYCTYVYSRARFLFGLNIYHLQW